MIDANSSAPPAPKTGLQEGQLLEQLRASNQTLGAVVQASPSAVMLLDLDGTVRLWNPAAERIFGWRADEALGRKLPSIGEAERPEFERSLARIAAGQVVDGLETVRNRRSGPFDAAVWAAPVRHLDGRVQCLSVVVDISVRKRAERMQRLVAEAGPRLAAPLQPAEVLELMASLPVPQFADACFVDLLEAGGPLREHAAAAFASGTPLQDRLRAAAAWAPRPEARLLGPGELEPGERTAALREAGVQSLATAPLLARGKLAGALTLCSRSRALDEQDLWLAGELARCASLSLESSRLFAAEHRARLRMTRMQEVAGALSGASTPAEVAEVACRIGSEAMEAKSGALWLLQPDGSLHLAGNWGTPARFMEAFLVLPASEGGPAVQVARSREALWVESDEDYRTASPEIFSVAQRAGRLSSFGAVPLLLRGGCLGVIVFSHAAPHRYEEDERAFYRMVAEHCAQAIDRARLLEAERRSNGRLLLLAQVGEALASSLQLDEGLTLLARRVVPAFADWCVVDLLEDDGRVRRVATVHPDPAQVALAEERARSGVRRLGDDSPIVRVIERGAPIFHPRLPAAVAESVARSPEELAALRQLVSAISIPLLRAGRPVGVISFTTTAGDSARVYTEDDFRFAQELGRRAGLAVANAQAYRRVRQGRERLAALQEVTLKLTVAQTVEEVARVSIEAGAAATSAPIATVYLLHENLELVAHRGLSAQQVEAHRLLPRDARRAAAEVARSGEPIWVESVAQHEERYPGQPQRLAASVGALLSFVSLPLRAKSGVLGVLTYAFREEHRFGADERVFLETLAESCGQSLERARLLDVARAAAERAEQASRVKDEFLAMLGHELRNPLAPIFTALELMKLRPQPGAGRERTIIERQARHLARLVDDLLDVSRIAAGRVRLDLAPVELAEAVARGLELARPLVEQNQHALRAEVPQGLLVKGDLTRLSQVVSNLLNNAAKYTPPGGNLAVRAAREGDWLVLRVTDDGLGLSPALLPRVFDLFSQGSQSLDRARGGLGLGLAIVRSLVQLHGGTVTAHSEGEGRGSEFVVRLPALEAAAGTALPGSAPPPDRRKAPRGRVLVVDDNEDAASLLAEALSLAGFTAHVAHESAAALAAAETFRPDVALLDLGLPVVDGFELARRLRAHPGLGALKLVAVTGYGQASDRERTRQAGFDEHLIKPVGLEQLEGVVAALLS